MQNINKSSKVLFNPFRLIIFISDVILKNEKPWSYFCSFGHQSYQLCYFTLQLHCRLKDAGL